MPRIDCLRSSAVVRTPRVMQLEGLFDLPPDERSGRAWSVDLPLEERDWQIGLIVGPSGCGKTTLARELFPTAIREAFDWPADRALIDGFPEGLGIREITRLLSSVGFSSPPSWLRPFRVLSNGEQFRATIARALAQSPELALIDEFTSVVDRTVAQIGSAAIARTVRRSGRRFVAVSCHFDIVDWLQPDWTYDPATEQFEWRSLQRRPPISLEIVRCVAARWKVFRQHHYLSGDLNRVARCFEARVAGRPAAFTAVLSHPNRSGGFWREHRTVCLPDFQGVGIGHALSEYVASLFQATGKRYLSITSHPGMIQHRLRSSHWVMYRAPSLGRKNTGREPAFNRTAALCRRTAGFRYVGPANFRDALKFGLAVVAPSTISRNDE
ncbi:MAG: ABC transporter ATP-binding protein [Planctomycetaceae bacterium]|nr:ABC transporter ATP-binding protein [Planctomycetaceae bacterium]